MSKISDFYDELGSILGALYPNHQRLGNPYRLDSNSDGTLDQGYGFSIGSGENTNREIQGRIWIRRTVAVALTRRFYALDDDPASKIVTEKALFEDQLALINFFENDPTMNQKVTTTRYVSDGGIETVESGRDQFLAVTTSFTVEYLEPIT